MYYIKLYLIFTYYIFNTCIILNINNKNNKYRISRNKVAYSSTHMCVYIRVYVCACVYVCAYVYVCICMCLCMHGCVHMCMCVYVCLSVYMCICVCMCMCVCVCVCVYVCVADSRSWQAGHWDILLWVTEDRKAGVLPGGRCCLGLTMGSWSPTCAV